MKEKLIEEFLKITEFNEETAELIITAVLLILADWHINDVINALKEVK